MPVQRVRRVVRKIDPWTVLKMSLVFNAIMALVFVLGTVVFWSIFVNAGIPDTINDLALRIGIEEGITLDGPTYFRVVVILAVIGTILMTGFFTLGAVIYNLISDLVGGVELIVLEETGIPHQTRPKVTLPVAAPRKTRPAKPNVEALPNVAQMRRTGEHERAKESASVAKAVGGQPPAPRPSATAHSTGEVKKTGS